ncbi:MAG TPA: hypothetical protein VLN45_04600 [Ignavibacteriaceae bacterium]|nr:hypothetical protein [Ignavibacteriaceae bacterium]
MIRFEKYLFIFSGVAFLLFLQSCSSSVETEKEVRYEEKKTIKNIDIEEREYISSAKISSIEKINFNLDSNGKPVKSEKLSTQKYNSKGFLTETIIYDSEEKIISKFKYDYDNNGKRIETTSSSDGSIKNYFTYEYDKYGNKIKAYRYDPSEKLEEYYFYEYDEEGNLIEEEWFASSGEKVYSVENDYDNGVKTRTSTFDENNNLIYEYFFKYDEKGYVIEELKYDSNGVQEGLIQYIYKYF